LPSYVSKFSRVPANPTHLALLCRTQQILSSNRSPRTRQKSHCMEMRPQPLRSNYCSRNC